MTKNPNQGFFLFGRVCVGGGAVHGRGDRAKRGMGRGVRALIFISDTLYYPYLHC